MTMNTRKTAEDDLLSDAQFYPIFDEFGNLVDIAHLEITTDRTRGIRAMEELADSNEPGDSATYADGWTGKWRRVLNTPAPGAAHSIKRSKRWDTQTSTFIPTATLILPFEVVWALFDRTFFGRYSIDVREVEFHSEDVIESTVPGANNAAGRVFYARAHVAITLHLENNQTRVYTGVGVAYDSVRAAMTGNTYAINSARRMAEKGAVSDAKREALATMGRVFNRAFEDGNQALRDIENKILEKIRKPAVTERGRVKPPASAAPRTSAPPQARKDPQEQGRQDARFVQEREDDGIPDDYIPFDAAEDAKSAKPKDVAKADAAQKPEGKKADSPKAAPAAKAASAQPAKADKGRAQKDTPAKVDNDAANAASTKKEAQAAQKTDQEEAKPAKGTQEEGDKAAAASKATAQKAQEDVPSEAQKQAPAQKEAPAPSVAKSQDVGYMLIVAGTSQRLGTPEEVFDAAMAALDAADGPKARAAFLERNKTTLLHAEKDDGSGALTYAELEAMIPDVEGEDTPAQKAQDEEPAPTQADVITPAKETGDAILAAYKVAFDAPKANVDAILMANTDWARRLTRRQVLQLSEMAAAAKVRKA